MRNGADWRSRAAGPRYYGVASDYYAVIEIFGPPEAIDEVDYQTAFEGTSMEVNFDRASPMVKMALKLVSDPAARFVGSQLDALATRSSVAAHQATKRYGAKFVRFLTIDVVDMVNTTISAGHGPNPSK